MIPAIISDFLEKALNNNFDYILLVRDIETRIVYYVTNGEGAEVLALLEDSVATYKEIKVDSK